MFGTMVSQDYRSSYGIVYELLVFGEYVFDICKSTVSHTKKHGTVHGTVYGTVLGTFPVCERKQ